ncbi:hypothetical protein O3G_MSEX014719 [Manduca sexta]|uniref:Uncharacterized protein n=1 Tax=Manduca sexta TaxID=7130 RepID=A0A921ZVI0_MANSE|nr:hypothetical protein O3G_MSEX014719 [Manduca sexta]
MASFNYGNNPYPGQPGQIPTYRPDVAPTPTQLSYPNLHPQNCPQYPQPGFVYGYPPNMAYPCATAPAPSAAQGMPIYPSVHHGSFTAGTPTVQALHEPIIEWIPTTPRNAEYLSNRAVVAGYEGHDGSPLWIIRAPFKGDLLPGKLAVKHHAAYVAWGGNENAVQQIEVCCARPEKIRWVESRDGNVPPQAIAGGKTASGETLYIGRAREQGSLTPGKVRF